MFVETHAASHVGRVRKGNEDNYLMLDVSNAKAWTSAQEAKDFVVESQRFEIDDKGIILAVSDGMGGALAGEVASKMAVDTVSEQFLNESLNRRNAAADSAVEKLYDATVYANYLIHRQGRSDPQYSGMGATFTGASVSKAGTLDLVQVGDSRAYLIRGGRIFQITKDQSLVQQLIDAKQITPEEAETHTLKNVILQALGAQNEIYPVPARLAPRRGDVLLLCSDGLSNKIGGEDMCRIVAGKAESLAQACGEMIRLANERGGEDNITLILARFSGDDLQEPDGNALEIEFLDFADIHDTADQSR
jgi:serine/threonine protein phosphatase PrpC